MDLRRVVFGGLALSLAAQDPGQPVDLQAIRQALSQAQSQTPVQGADATPRGGQALRPEAVEAAAKQKKEEQEKLEKEIAEAKKKENAPRRFAADLFDVRQVNPTFTEGGISEDYVLAVGDQLQLNVFGSATFEVPLQVDGRGQVAIPKVGTVRVGGRTLAQARGAVQAKVGENFSKATVDLSVIRMREVRVFVLGEVYKPGSFLVPSLSSVVNVLGLSGGPTAVGSFRQVRLIRGGRVVHTVDLYPLRAEGSGNMNFVLQNGDILFVPLALQQVMLEGGFTRVAGGELKVAEVRAVDAKAKSAVGAGKENLEPAAEAAPPMMQFELVPGETAAAALKFAGGLLPGAYPDGLVLRRQDAQGVINVEDLPVARLAETRLLRGDVLSALPRRERLERVVSLTGWARVPGVFSRTEGMKVADLLRRSAQVMPDTYLERGEIVRTLADGRTQYLNFHVGKALAGDAGHNLALENRDRVELFRVDRMRLPKKVSISGPLTNPGSFDLHEGMRVADLIFRAGIPQKSANRYVAELARSRDGQPSQVLKLDVGKLLSSEDQSPLDLKDDALNPRLLEDDRVSIFEKPDFRLHRTVRIHGQVARPGAYVLDQAHTTLAQLVARAGGLLPEAMPQAGIFLRRLGGSGENLDATEATLTRGIDEVLERLNEKKYIADPKGDGKLSVPMLFRPPVFHTLADAKLNRMVVDFAKALEGKDGQTPELQDGDEVIIPRKTDSALVVGETASPFASYKVTDKTRVKDLIALAGGTTRNADTSNVRLLKADGRIIDRGVGGQAVEPGDAVLVPQRVRRETSWQENLSALTPIAILISALRR